MSCEHGMDDGAYILGALAPAERAAFERHLATCTPCRDAVAQLAVLPGLLGRLDPLMAQSRVTAPTDLLPRVLAAARGQRRIQRRRRLLAAVAAAVAAIALAAAVGVGVHLYDRRDPAPAEIVYTAMEHTGGYSPVEAEIGIGETDGGSIVAVRCRYHTGTGSQGSWPVWLVIYPRDESAEPIGSWFATPGRDVDIRYVTRHAPDEIVRIELQDDDQATLAWWTP